MYAMALGESFFFGAFSIFESGGITIVTNYGITKHLMTGPSGNSEFSFPKCLITAMFAIRIC